jgi:hypothetical protein
MKKTLIISAFCVGAAVSGYSQGIVGFTDRDTDMTIHIFAPQTQSPGTEVTGNQGTASSGASTGGVTTDIYVASPGGTAVYGGSTVYTGGAIGNTLTSNPTAAGAYHYNVGSDYTVELYGAAGANAAASALVPVTQYSTTISTSSAIGGAFKSIQPFAGDPGVPGATAGGVVTIELVAWYNGGTGLTLAEALAADDPTGTSAIINYTTPGGSPPGTPGDMVGLTSFSLAIAPAVTPEPSTIALGVIGATTLLFRRRK